MNEDNPLMGIGRRLTELRRSGAAGIHKDKRTKKNRSRKAQRDNSIRESKED